MCSYRCTVSDLVVNTNLYMYDAELLGLTLQYKLCDVQIERYYDIFIQHVQTALTQLELPIQTKHDFLKHLELYQWNPFVAVSSNELRIRLHKVNLHRGALLRRAILSTLSKLSTNSTIRQSYLTFRQAQDEIVATEKLLKQRLRLMSKHLDK